jgi:hypothetical protein
VTSLYIIRQMPAREPQETPSGSTIPATLPR